MVVRWRRRRFSKAKLSDRPSGHPDMCKQQQCRLETEQDCLWVAAISDEAGHCLFGHAFLAQFHEDWFTHHFQWLQAVDDVAKKPGFRSRQILVRCCLMQKDPEELRTPRIDSNLFGDCDSNLTNFDNKKKQKQKKKSQAFIEEAAVSLDKHHLRWCNELLTAALGGEAPLGEVVARVLLNHDLPDNPFEQNQIEVCHFSKDHGHHLHANTTQRDIDNNRRCGSSNYYSTRRLRYQRSSKCEEDS
jgi:hypothetical protein